MTSDWDSRYAAEGRDTLDGDGLWHSSLEWSDGPLALGLWHGRSTGREFEEWQYSAVLAGSAAGIDGYIGYTHVRVPTDDAQDDEVGAGLAWTEAYSGIELAVDAYHSFAADGAFIESSATRSWDAWRGADIDLSVIFGMNQGYVPDGHDGANHLALSLGLRQQLTDALTLEVHGAWSWAIDRDSNRAGDEALEDFFHVGGGLAWSF